MAPVPVGTIVPLRLVVASTASVLQSRSLWNPATRVFLVMSQEAATVSRFVVTRRTLDDPIRRRWLAWCVEVNVAFIRVFGSASDAAELVLVDGLQSRIAGTQLISGSVVDVQEVPVESR